MRRYRMPADLNEKDKVIGGILTIAQALWVVPGIILALIVFTLVGKTLKVFAIIPCALAFSTCLPFVFYKVNGVPLPTYIMRKHKFKQKNKVLPNIREDFDFLKED